MYSTVWLLFHGSVHNTVQIISFSMGETLQGNKLHQIDVDSEYLMMSFVQP